MIAICSGYFANETMASKEAKAATSGGTQFFSLCWWIRAGAMKSSAKLLINEAIECVLS